MSNGIIRLAESQLPSSCLSITGRQRSSFARSCLMVIIPADCWLFLFVVFAPLPLQHLSADVLCKFSMVGLTPVYAACGISSGRLMSLNSFFGS